VDGISEIGLRVFIKSGGIGVTSEDNGCLIGKARSPVIAQELEYPYGLKDRKQ